MKKIIWNGFTLIELLIVMSIIAVLAGLSLFALRGTRESARDGRRQADLEMLRSALEIYRADCDYYPNNGFASDGDLDGADAPCSLGSGNVYLQEVPDDPLAGYDYVYQAQSCTSGTNCRGYRIWTSLEDPPTLPSSCPAPAPTCGSVACNYCVNNP